ncbi:MAG: ferritin family protein [Phycisphaerales bacterium]|nr:MAG: ferritin family protein [Phycisphaerales bacterium]
MGEVSTLGEAIELAITREVQAAEFYMELAGRTKNPAMQSLFESLSEEELRHKARLELEMMKEGLVAQTVGRLFEVGRPDYAADDQIGADMDYQDVLSLAVRKERRSFRFYVELAGVAAEKHLHDVLLELAEEEARHLVQFEMEYDRLTRKQD